jgi:hypothetical protein
MSTGSERKRGAAEKCDGHEKGTVFPGKAEAVVEDRARANLRQNQNCYARQKQCRNHANNVGDPVIQFKKTGH